MGGKASLQVMPCSTSEDNRSANHENYFLNLTKVSIKPDMMYIS